MSFPSYNNLSSFTPTQQQELMQFAAYLQGYLSAEHKDSGAHAAVTADSITTTGAATIGTTVSAGGDVIANSGVVNTLGYSDEVSLRSLANSFSNSQTQGPGVLLGSTTFTDAWGIINNLSHVVGVNGRRALAFMRNVLTSADATILELTEDDARTAGSWYLYAPVGVSANLGTPPGSISAYNAWNNIYCNAISATSFNAIPFASTTSASLNDALAHSAGSVPSKSGHLTITSTAGSTTIPFWANGGSGVAFKWTALDPDTGWVVNTAPSFSFQDASATNTYTVTFSGGNGDLSVTRTAGASAYTLTLVTVN